MCFYALRRALDRHIRGAQLPKRPKLPWERHQQSLFSGAQAFGSSARCVSAQRAQQEQAPAKQERRRALTLDAASSAPRCGGDAGSSAAQAASRPAALLGPSLSARCAGGRRSPVALTALVASNARAILLGGLTPPSSGALLVAGASTRSDAPAPDRTGLCGECMAPARARSGAHPAGRGTLT